LPDGTALKDDNYSSDVARLLGIYLNGADLDMTSPLGEKITDDNFMSSLIVQPILLIINCHPLIMPNTGRK